MNGTTILPNHTLYINNLNDKISKRDLKEVLYHMFSQHGKVIDIVALKTMKARGQAFVVFEEIAGATLAMRSLEGFPLFERPMKIQYAKSKSNIIKVREGTILKKESRKQAAEVDEEAEARKRIKRMEDAENANELLFVSQLPDSITNLQLEALFGTYDGFKEVRMIPAKPLAFVEYETINQAAAAKEVLNGFEISPNHVLKVDFAQR